MGKNRTEEGVKDGKQKVKPLTWKDGKRFVRYSQGAEMYSMGITKFQQLAKEAKACYKLNQLVLVNLDIFDAYLETFHIEDDEFYK